MSYGLTSAKNFVSYTGISSVTKKQEIVKISPNSTLVPTVVLFKSDLRTIDNPALWHASKFAASKESKKGSVVGLFICCVDEWKIHRFSDCKIGLMMKSVFSLQWKLQKEFNIPLFVVNEPNASHVPSTITQFCEEIGANALFYNAQYELDEKRRDKCTEELLELQLGINSYSFQDQCVVPQGLCKTLKGNDFRVFTPFKKCWFKKLEDTDKDLLLEIPIPFKNPSSASMLKISLDILSYESTSLKQYIEEKRLEIGKYVWEEEKVHQLADEFFNKKVSQYKEKRNFPNEQGTSCISPYLSLGIISAKVLVNKAREQNKGRLSIGNEGVSTWISEICWRDFYRNIVVTFPHIMKNLPFKKEAEEIQWSADKEHFKRWCEGKTGFPIVDAGMRQLNATGWMHNRLRMIVAMFLTKDLLIDWRWGEEYFSENLIDADFASNNGGWQWSASTGTDSQPYFRIFNPVLQSRRYDPDGTFIKRWVVELSSLYNPFNIHDPRGTLSEEQFKQLNYPEPIVDHEQARKRAISEFKRVYSVAKE